MGRTFRETIPGWAIAPVDDPLIEELAGTLPAQEAILRGRPAGAARDAEGALWAMVAAGVPEARGWPAEAGGLAALCERALRLRGGPDGAKARYVMREKERTWTSPRR